MIRLPRTLEGLKPVLILPPLGTRITGLPMVLALATPIAALLALLTRTLQHMQGSSALGFGLLLANAFATPTPEPSAVRSHPAAPRTRMQRVMRIRR